MAIRYRRVKARVREDLIFFGKICLKKDQIIELEMAIRKQRTKVKVNRTQLYLVKDSKKMPINFSEVEILEFVKNAK